MKLIIEVPEQLNMELYQEVIKLRDAGVKTSKSKLVLKYLELGFRKEATK